MDDSLRVSILSEALPYIQSFSGRKIVVKYGGSIMEDEKLNGPSPLESLFFFGIENALTLH